jgi:hypothetical protein
MKWRRVDPYKIRDNIVISFFRNSFTFCLKGDENEMEMIYLPNKEGRTRVTRWSAGCCVCVRSEQKNWEKKKRWQHQEKRGFFFFFWLLFSFWVKLRIGRIGILSLSGFLALLFSCTDHLLIVDFLWDCFRQ